mmetsp:Transcript_3394/g.4196  ORF Transcript_3394/g.4196 Transcript_3394/m.4196 type:complete len:157 (+) Transcript_3394:219-689(+)
MLLILTPCMAAPATGRAKRRQSKVLSISTSKMILYTAKKCFEAQQKKTKTTNTESDEEGKFVYCKTYKDVMKQIFNLMDEDGNGTISRSEFNKFFTAMGASQREIGMMFNVASPRANKQVMKKFFSDDDQDARNVKEDGLSLEEWADFYLKTFVFF